MLLWEVRLYLWNVPKHPLVTLPWWTRSICAVCITVCIELGRSRKELGSKRAMVVHWVSVATSAGVPELFSPNRCLPENMCQCLLSAGEEQCSFVAVWRQEGSQPSSVLLHGRTHLSALKLWLFKMRPSRLQLCSSFLHSLECAPVSNTFFY